jgi:hypothetical protein
LVLESVLTFTGVMKLLVNGTDVSGQQQLKNSDVIEVAGVSMTFYTIPPRRNIDKTASLFEIDPSLRKRLVTGIGQFLSMLLKTLEHMSTSRLLS